jgi:hypothetical protein
MALDSIVKTKLQNTKDKLDITSPSFCLAKWNQVTIHLTNGTTHSCHHCPPHPIPVAELKDNPSALHNTNQKKQTRKDMLEGKRPSECNFCWRVEDLKDPDIFSDRVRKSTEYWNNDRLETIPQMPWNVNINPTYIEIDFSNTCNFKCLYCSPAYSSTWVKEIREHGPIEAGTFKVNSLQQLKVEQRAPVEVDEDDNPYVQAFWKWFPDVLKEGKLRELRITGGEPLLSKNTFKLMDYLIDNPQPNLNFSINTNLGAPKLYIDKLVTYINKLTDTNSIKGMLVYTSGEAHGKKTEYVRYGINYKEWLANVDRLFTECPKLHITYMCTYNALSVTSFKKFLEDAYALIVKHSSVNGRGQPLVISIPYMRDPEFLAGWILTEDYIKYIEECVGYMRDHLIHWTPKYIDGEIKYDEHGYRISDLTTPGFSKLSVHDMERVLEVMKNAIINNEGRNRDVATLRRSFHQFVDECDKRRGTSFLSTFPEMAEFYHMCKNEYP